jgi:mycofactocin precursor
VSEPTTTQDAQVTEAEVPAENTAPEVLVEDELLVEDISIDGMCGVY